MTRKPTPNERRVCPLGHAITRGYPLWHCNHTAGLPWEAPHECDACGRHIGWSEEIIWPCIDCDFDLCDACFSNSSTSTDALLLQARRRGQQQQQERVVYRTGYAATTPTVVRCGLAVVTPASSQTSSSAPEMRAGSPGNKSRYNYQRPNYRGLRVSIADYPDPCDYGWMFTGSNEQSRVEFFEKKTISGRCWRLLREVGLLLQHGNRENRPGSPAAGPHAAVWPRPRYRPPSV